MIANANSLHIPLTDQSVHCIVGSPPYYGLRDYGLAPTPWPAVSYSPLPGLPEITIPAEVSCLGLETTLEAYVGHIVAIARELWRVLRDDGTFWLNVGDSYSARTFGSGGTKSKQPTNAGSFYDADFDLGSLKPKDLMLVPHRLALALQADGWYVRSDIVWAKSNPMPESVTDRPTKAHEYVFLLSKRARYYYDAEAVKERSIVGFKDFSGERVRNIGGRTDGFTRTTGSFGADGKRNRRSVWRIATQPYSAAHFAVWPPKLVEPMILAGTSATGVCAECGKPWERVVEKTTKTVVSHKGSYFDTGKTGINGNGRTQPGERFLTKDTGQWQPACTCNAPTVPATVLDPWCGSGTTGEVCRRFGRHFIGLDLNPVYLAEFASYRAGSKPVQMDMMAAI